MVRAALQYILIPFSALPRYIVWAIIVLIAVSPVALERYGIVSDLSYYYAFAFASVVLAIFVMEFIETFLGAAFYAAEPTFRDRNRGRLVLMALFGVCGIAVAHVIKHLEVM